MDCKEKMRSKAEGAAAIPPPWDITPGGVWNSPPSPHPSKRLLPVFTERQCRQTSIPAPRPDSNLRL